MTGFPVPSGLIERLMAQVQQQRGGASSYNPGAFTQFTPAPAPDFGPYAPPVQRIQSQQIATGFPAAGQQGAAQGMSPFHSMVSSIFGQMRPQARPIYTPLPQVGPFAQMRPVSSQPVPFAAPSPYMPRMIEAAKLGANR